MVSFYVVVRSRISARLHEGEIHSHKPRSNYLSSAHICHQRVVLMTLKLVIQLAFRALLLAISLSRIADIVECLLPLAHM